MGAEFYSYWVEGDPEPEEALRALRESVFQRGEFWGADEHPNTIEGACLLAGASGTRSILDISGISEREEIGAASGLEREELEFLFGTEFPERRQIEECDELAEDISRGCARYVRAYEGGKVVGIVFVGYSVD